MQAKKISFSGAIILLALALSIAGCSPSGPRALRNGIKLLDRGDYSGAVAQFKTATTLLATNAPAWNYYGVALESAGQLDDAATAYQNALKYDRDLVEVHFNLGSLWLEQNKPDAAKTEFTAYTLRRGNDPAGWQKLGSAQLRLSETVAAEKSFSTVLSLKPGDADAYNGLGLARVQRGMPRDAVKFFAAAVQAKPDFAAAILNLATTSQQYLRDNKMALENYRAYLALTPRPANWDEVNALVNQLEQPQTVASANPPPVESRTPPPAVQTPQPRTEARTEMRPEARNNDSNNPRPTVSPRTPPPRLNQTPAPVQTTPMQTVQIQPSPQIIASPRAASAASRSEPMVQTLPDDAESDQPAPSPKTGFWHRLFGSNKEDANSKYLETGLTPLPSETQTAQPVSTPAPAPVVTFPRYHYLSPSKPAAGDYRAADGAFTKARLFEQEEKWTDAMQWYQQAAQFDPSWFEAQYNTGVLAHRLRNFPLALPSYEYALAIQPDSTDARYNFALALKAAGYVPDAAEQFKKILAADPNSVRTHLALGNLYAQLLHENGLARQQYLKVLDLDPKNDQATDIRFWLSANPK